MKYTDLVCFAIFDGQRQNFFSWCKHYGYAIMAHPTSRNKSFNIPPDTLLYEYQFAWRDVDSITQNVMLAFSVDADAIAMLKLSTTLKPIDLTLQPPGNEVITYYVTSF